MHISRRNLLAGVPAGVALLAAGPAESQEHKTASADLKLGVASYSFRKFSREQAIRMTRELGVTYINVKEFHLAMNSKPEEIDAARKQFTDAGLIIDGCGNVNFQKDDESDIRNKFEYAKRLGAPVIVCAPTPQTLPKLEKFVKEYNIKVAVHNHGPEDKYFPSPASVMAAVKDLDPRCGLCIDIGHTVRTGADVVQAIADAGSRLHDLHTKDLRDTNAKESQVAVGRGSIPIPRIFEQLMRQGYNGWVDLEYEIEENNPMPGMQESVSYMRGVLAGLKATRV